MKIHFLLLVITAHLSALFSSCQKQGTSSGSQEPPKEISHPLKVISDEDFLNNKGVFYLYYFIPDSVFERMKGRSFPEGCEISKEDLIYLKVKHYGFDGEVHVGELVVSRKMSNVVSDIFTDLFNIKYPIEKIRLIDEYDADDEASMKDNNTSAFCYRKIAGSEKLSMHAQGLAIDINPLYNPCVSYKDGKVSKVEPKEGEQYIERDTSDPRRIKRDDPCYRIFIDYGFTWGGDWKTKKDYQHFEYSK